jgi:replication factor C subunit 3/5
MTFDAQFALRRIIEKYSETTRFCLICNYENKIIADIISSCKMLRFSPISSVHIENRLKYICDNEKLTYEPTVLNIISLLSKGDLRKSINFLQSLALQAPYLTLNNCYKLAGIPSLTEVKELLENLLDDNIDFNFVIKKLDNLIRINGYSLSLVVKEIIAYLLSDINVYKSIDSYKLACYISDISDLENRVSKSTFEDIYISGLVGIFKKNCILLP